jgi:hypothetical protein
MNYANIQLLADSRNTDRLDAAHRRSLRARFLCLLRSQARIEPADVPVLLSGRRIASAPGWWTALQKGQTVATPAAREVKVPASECTEC